MKRYSLFAVALLFLSSMAGAQSLDAELKKIDKLRLVFGDALVNSLTNLPPDQYKAARDKALAEADRAGSNLFTRDEARDKLCATYAKAGYACHEVVETASDENENGEGTDTAAVSGVSKGSEDLQQNLAEQPAASSEDADAVIQSETDPDDSVDAVAANPKAEEVAPKAHSEAKSEIDQDDPELDDVSADATAPEPRRQVSSEKVNPRDPVL